MKTRTLVIIASVILLIISALYYNQGGFNDVEVNKIETKRRYILGKHFKGNVSSKSFTQLFVEIRDLKQTQNLDGDLGNIYFNDPEKSEGEIDAFFGVISELKPKEINGFDIFEIKSNNYLQGTIKASSAFVNKTYSAIFEYADKNSIILEEEYIEWFPSENEIVVQIKIKNE